MPALLNDIPSDRCSYPFHAMNHCYLKKRGPIRKPAKTTSWRARSSSALCSTPLQPSIPVRAVGVLHTPRALFPSHCHRGLRRIAKSKGPLLRHILLSEGRLEKTSLPLEQPRILFLIPRALKNFLRLLVCVPHSYPSRLRLPRAPQRPRSF